MNIVGRSVLIVVDIQGIFNGQPGAPSGIPTMGGAAQRLPGAIALVEAARAAAVPVIFIQEVHKPSLIDIGRELDGAEGPHAIEGDPGTELASGLIPAPEEFLIRKRRYSAFFGTELEIVLKAYKAETVFLIGGLTDVCIHYTAADAHQHDYHVRVVTDLVGGSSHAAHRSALAAIEYLQRDALVTSDEVTEYFTMVAGRA
ncbi:cysteine hydrolase family protein [Nocardia miyunensis]|uniref:cysteine hydrolase family protein n=1 Tax=Nocardia miyunensis TaxID=282684 RepID=UPI00082F7454|nr:isochorismatase family cysteine hydrolase [Nocardia miyunensis]